MCQQKVIEILKENGGFMNAKDICEKGNFNQASVSRCLKILYEKDDMVFKKVRNKTQGGAVYKLR